MLCSASLDLPVSDLFTPKPVPMCNSFCDTSFQFTTTTISGSGGTCTDAQTNLSSQLVSLADSGCFNHGYPGHSCDLGVTTTVACTEISPGVFQVQGYATYNCKDNNC
jgi:hypothetical protein